MARKGIYQAGVDRLGMWKVVIARGGIHWGCGCIREIIAKKGVQHPGVE